MLNRLPTFVPIIHIGLAVLLILELGLISYLTSATTPRPPSSVSFLLFTTIWSLLSLAYLALSPLYFSQFYSDLAALALESVTMIFWFAGSIALAAATTPYCGGNSVCGGANAAAAFGFFVWAGFALLVFIDARAVLEKRRSAGTGAAAAAGGPKPYVAA